MGEKGAIATVHMQSN